MLRDAERALASAKTGFPLLEAMVFDLQVIADAPGQGKVVWELPGDTAKRAGKDFDALFTEALEVLRG